MRSSAGKTSASTCTTWRAKSTNSSDPDPLDDAISDLVRSAQQDLDGASKGDQERDRGELVERPAFFSFILMAPGYCIRDFKVRVVRDELRIDAPDFEVTRRLGCRVDLPGAETDYRNGVLSVRVPKKF